MNYDKFQFPDYVYHEFPKWVDTVNGQVLVQSVDEELSSLETLEVEEIERVKRPYKRKDI